MLQQLGEGARLHQVLPPADGELAVEQLLQELDREVALRHAVHLGQELVRQDRDVRLLEAGGGEDVDHALRRDGTRDDLAHGVVQLLVRPRFGGRAFASTDCTAWEERHIVADTHRVVMRHREREGAGEVAHDLYATVLAVLLREYVFLRRRQQAQPFPRRAGSSRGAVETVKQGAADLVLFQHHRHRLALIERGTSGAAALGVGRERPLELVGEPEIIDDEAARLVPEHPIDARDRLPQPWPRIGLSTYMVCRLGASKPVSHMSRTSTT